MTEEQKDEQPQAESENRDNEEVASAETVNQTESIDELKRAVSEANDKYVRLYADFENYKKIAARNREDLLKYANEDLMVDMLTVIDHLELALQHASDNDVSNSLAEGVNLTLKELKNVLEKHGLVAINALGKPFDPSVHHAMSQIESEEVGENTIVKEFRKGYMLKDRVLRAAMVGVAKTRAGSVKEEPSDSEERDVTAEEKNK
jgi:molecular chaperone GrpE